MIVARTALLVLTLAACRPADVSPSESGPGDSAGDSPGDSTDSGPDESGSGDSDTGAQPPTEAFSFPRLAGKNLVYVHIDTIRADRFPMYGYGRATTPNLAAEELFVLRGSYSESSWTVPSLGSLLTGQPSERHQMVDQEGSADTWHPTTTSPMVTERLREAGYQTGCWTGSTWIQGSDFANGFDVVELHAKDGEQSNLAAVLDGAMAWVDARDTSRPFFLFFQPMDMHQPYWVDPRDRGAFVQDPVPFDLDELDITVQNQQIQTALREDAETTTRVLSDVYDEELLGLDRSLGALFDALAARGLLEDTAVVIGGDHGEHLNDDYNNQVGHGKTVREEVVSVPLFVAAPGLGAGELDCIANNDRIFPSLLQAMELEPLAAAGAPLSEGCAREAVSTLYTDGPYLTTIGAGDGRERLVWDCDAARVFGFDLVADPAQRTELTREELVRGAEFEAAIRERYADIVAFWPTATCAGR